MPWEAVDGICGLTSASSAEPRQCLSRCQDGHRRQQYVEGLNIKTAHHSRVFAYACGPEQANACSRNIMNYAG